MSGYDVSARHDTDPRHDAGPATHRRRPGWLRRTAGRIGAGLLVVATLAAGVEIIVRTPDSDHISRYFLRSGDVGERVEALDFAATVTSVRGGTAVVGDRGQELHTDGAWILVRIRVEALTEPQSLRFGAIYDRRGRTFEYAGRVDQLLDAEVQPGIPIEGEMIFEVPRDAVPDAHLRLFNALVGDPNYQTMVDVDLGLDEATLDAWIADPEPLRVAQLEVSTS